MKPFRTLERPYASIVFNDSANSLYLSIDRIYRIYVCISLSIYLSIYLYVYRDRSSPNCSSIVLAAIAHNYQFRILLRVWIGGQIGGSTRACRANCRYVITQRSTHTHTHTLSHTCKSDIGPWLPPGHPSEAPPWHSNSRVSMPEEASKWYKMRAVWGLG